MCAKEFNVFIVSARVDLNNNNLMDIIEVSPRKLEMKCLLYSVYNT